MNAWNFDRKSKTMQNVDANFSLYRSWYAYLWEGKRVFSFHLKNQKFPNNYFEQIKIKDKQYIPKSFLFLKAIKRVRVSFPKRETTSTLHAYALYFFDFSWNIDRSNLKLHYFSFDEIVLMQERQNNKENMKACEANQRSNALCSVMIMT